MKNLKELWLNLTATYSNNTALTEELWAEIETNHSCESRHYHTLEHLQHMANLATKHKTQLNDANAVLFSIFYHDLVYKVTGATNEEESAKAAAERMLQLGVPQKTINNCKKLILATKDHVPTTDTDTNFLLDFDLAILGETPENYKNYTRKVRKEYANFSDLIYKTGRKKVLQHFLAMERIFKTEFFYHKHEQQAIDNLKTELRCL